MSDLQKYVEYLVFINQKINNFLKTKKIILPARMDVQNAVKTQNFHIKNRI